MREIDIVVEIELEALRLLLDADPDPNMDPTMRQLHGLSVLLSLGLEGRTHLRHGTLRVITGVPISSQWGLSSWAHHQLINYFKEKEEEDVLPGKWKLSIRGRRLIDECARIAEDIASEHEDRLDTHRSQAEVWDLWKADRELSARHA